MTLYYTENIAIPFSGVKRYFNLRQLCGVVKYPEVNSVYSVSNALRGVGAGCDGFRDE